MTARKPKSQHKPAGRPTVMTEDVLRKLEEAFAYGASDGEAMFYADISKTAFYEYEAAHPEFKDRKEMLKDKPILLARRSVVDGLEANPELALKFLSRKRRDEFAEKTEISNPGQADALKALENTVRDVLGGQKK